MSQKRLLSLFLLLTVALSGCNFSWPWTKTTSLARGTPDGLYEQGVAYYQDGSYKKAVEVFQRLKEEYPLSRLAILAEMGIADSYFSDKEYGEAELAYREFVELHPTNENLPYVMYQIGMCHFNQISDIDRDQSETVKALKEFERLTARFPSSKFSFLAEKMIRDCRRILGEHEFYVGEYYFKRKQYPAALRRFERIARDFGDVGLDYKVGVYMIEAKKRIAEDEQRNSVKDKRVN